MTKHASGTFEVKMTPQTSTTRVPSVGRYLLDKQFHGDIEGTSKGEMLAVSTQSTALPDTSRWNR